MASTPSHKTGRPSAETATSSFLLGNLHCPTCVATIRRVLHESCEGHVRWVSPNIVTSVVTVEHDPAASIDVMARALEDEGFELCGVTSTADHEPPTSGPSGETSQQDKARPSSALSRWVRSPRLARRTAGAPSSQSEAHLQNCEQCRTKTCVEVEKQGQDKVCTIVTEAAASLSHAGSAAELGKAAAKPARSTIMSTKSFVTVDTEDPLAPSRPTWRATIAVGGMTCAVCVNAITDELKKLGWISSVVVNLLSNSATVEINDKAKADKLVEAIEDLGYEAAIDSVVPVEPEKPRGRERTVEILVEGLYCEHCPGRVTSSLAGFRRAVDVVSQPTMQRPVIKLSYVPEAPKFTIRHMLAAIEASDPAFTASVYHPPTLEERSKLIQAKHRRQILYRVIFTFLVCIPTFVIGIVYMSLLPDDNMDKHHIMAPWTSGISRAQVALFAMATPVYFYSAAIFHVRAFKEIRTLWRRGSRTPVLQRFYRFGSMNTLMSLGTTIAYVSSVSQMLAAARAQPDEINDSNFYFDSVIFLTFFLLLGRLIEAYSKSRTGSAVEALVRLRPTTAILVERAERGDTSTVVEADLLDLGDVVRVTQGASPPADGVVVHGETSFDESSLTGESRLIKKAAGDDVFSGTVNKGAPILARVTGAAGTSMLDQIVAVVREGQTKRAPMERIADLLTTYFVPIVTLVAIATWIIWLTVGLMGMIPGHFLDVTSGGWVAFSLQFAIAVFVVACPCGLGLAAPTALFVAGGIAAKHGILAKGGGEAFEKASKVDCVVFDKTGTLTMGGEPSITDADIYPEQERDEDRKAKLLAALKALEENSSHPIAKAVVSFCAANQPAADAHVEDLQEIPGKGMKATYGAAGADDAFELIVGNEALMADFSVAISPRIASLLQQWKSEAKSVALAATRPLSSPEAAYALAAALSISDPIRPEARAIVSALQERGVRVYMLSGDNATTAAAVASRVGIAPDHVIANVLPSEKAARIQHLQASLHAQSVSLSPTGRRRTAESATRRATVAMVGDGINDSPALTQADVGIAIGSGSDVAISSSDFVLVTSSLASVLTLLALSRAVFRRIMFNFGWALIYNVVAVPVAAGVLYPIKNGAGQHVRLDPVWASLAMALSSISVVMSSLALGSGLPLIGFRDKAVTAA